MGSTRCYATHFIRQNGRQPNGPVHPDWNRGEEGFAVPEVEPHALREGHTQLQLVSGTHTAVWHATCVSLDQSALVGAVEYTTAQVALMIRAT